GSRQLVGQHAVDLGRRRWRRAGPVLGEELDLVHRPELEGDLLHPEDVGVVHLLLVAEHLDEADGIVGTLGLVVAGLPLGPAEDDHVGHLRYIGRRTVRLYAGWESTRARRTT